MYIWLSHVILIQENLATILKYFKHLFPLFFLRQYLKILLTNPSAIGVIFVGPQIKGWLHYSSSSNYTVINYLTLFSEHEGICMLFLTPSPYITTSLSLQTLLSSYISIDKIHADQDVEQCISTMGKAY